MKKINFKIVLLIALIVSINRLYAEEKIFPEGSFKYTVKNGNASITDYNGDDKNLIIPEKLGKYDVTNIGEGAFKGCENLTIENKDSYAHKYAQENNIGYEFAPDTSWLN